VDDSFNNKNIPKINASTLKQLQNPSRQKILRFFQTKDKIAYTTLEESLDIPSGTLWYHLKLLDGLITQDHKRKYYLTADGIQALNYLYSVGSQDKKDKYKNNEDKLNQLSHPMRRKILITIEQESNFGIGYNELLAELNLTSGTLYYHLKFLQGLIQQNNDKKYTLTSSGVQTLDSFFQHIQTGGISISQATNLLEKGNYNDLIQKITPSSKNLNATYILIDAYINTRQIDKAEHLIENVLNQVDTFENQLYTSIFSAKCLIAEKKFAEAEKITLQGLELFRKTSSRRKKFLDLHNNFELILGECFWRQHKIAEGLDLLEKLFNKTGDNDHQIKGLIHDNIAGIYWVKGDEYKAVEYAKSALKYFHILKNPNLIEIAKSKIETWTVSKAKVSGADKHFKQLFKDTLDNFKI